MCVCNVLDKCGVWGVWDMRSSWDVRECGVCEVVQVRTYSKVRYVEIV